MLARMFIHRLSLCPGSVLSCHLSNLFRTCAAEEGLFIMKIREALACQPTRSCAWVTPEPVSECLRPWLHAASPSSDVAFLSENKKFCSM